MNDFLPKGYEPPPSGKPYTRLEQGDTKIRILGNPIMGMEYWIKSMDEAGKETNDPIRSKMGVDIDIANVPEPDKVKHFWAMIVWNYGTKRLEVFQFTQRTIQTPIRALSKNKAWGDPKGTDGYDLVINKSGELLQTNYTVTPNPKTKLDKAIIEKFEKSDIYLEALFTSDDPFAGTPIDTKEIE